MGHLIKFLSIIFSLRRFHFRIILLKKIPFLSFLEKFNQYFIIDEFLERSSFIRQAPDDRRKFAALVERLYHKSLGDVVSELGTLEYPFFEAANAGKNVLSPDYDPTVNFFICYAAIGYDSLGK